MGGRTLGTCSGTDSRISVDAKDSLLLSAFGMLTPVGVHKLLRYVMGRLDSVICFTVAVQLYHLLQPGTWARVSDKFVHNV